MSELTQPKASPGMLEMLETMNKLSGENDKPSFVAKLFTPSRIVTSHMFPPVPFRTHDWAAFYDGEEEAGNYGYGATEAEAIRDFIENCAEDHDERLSPTHNPDRKEAGE